MSAKHQASGQDAVSVLSSSEYCPIHYRERHAALAQRLGLSVESILFSLEHIPLCLDGDLHVQKRREVAKLIGERRTIVDGAIDEIVAKNFGGFARTGRIDVMATCVIPAVDELIAALIGVETGLAEDSLVSRVFSQTKGVAKRRRMDAELSQLLDRVKSQFPDDSRDRIGSRIALAILGRDALQGTIARSLRAHFENLDGKPLHSKSMAPVPTHTGVPFIDRQAKVEIELAGDLIAKDDVVRCHLDSFEGDADGDRSSFFGAGSHLCLGKPISLKFFQEISRFFNQLNTCVRETEFQLRKDDVFLIPSTFKVEITK